jgi:hypothetical protein
VDRKIISVCGPSKRNDHNLLESFQGYRIDHINNLCSSLDDFNIKSKETTTNNNSNPPSSTEPLVYIENQVEFFKKMSTILNSFVDLYGYLLFKLNNNLNLETSSGDKDAGNLNYFKFEKFEEFLQHSGPLMVKLL